MNLGIDRVGDNIQHRDWWTATELAQAAGVNASRIRQLLIAGLIRGEKFAGVWRISDREAQRWLNERHGG